MNETQPTAYRTSRRPTRQAEAWADTLPARDGDETGCAYIAKVDGAWYLLNAAAYDLADAADEGGYVLGGAEEIAGEATGGSYTPTGERVDPEALAARVRELASQQAEAA